MSGSLSDSRVRQTTDEHDEAESSEPRPRLTFVSHAHEDTPFARSLLNAIEAANVAAFFEDDMAIGTLAGDHMSTRAATADQAFVVLSRPFLTKKWTMMELNLFMKNGIRIYPLYYGVDTDQFQLILATYDRHAGDDEPAFRRKMKEHPGEWQNLMVEIGASIHDEGDTSLPDPMCWREDVGELAKLTGLRREGFGADDAAYVIAVVKMVSPPLLPAAVPPLPDSFANVRPLDDLVLELLDCSTNTEVRGLVLTGNGGAGKSVIASAVVRDKRIRRHFADGVVWLDEEPGEYNTQRFLLKLNMLAQQFENVVLSRRYRQGRDSKYEREFTAVSDAEKFFQLWNKRFNLRCLLVVDNACNVQVLQTASAMGFQILATTRTEAAIPAGPGWRSKAVPVFAVPREPAQEAEKEEEPDDQGFGWDNSLCPFAKETSSGVDRLAYDVYANALAGLFSTGETDVLPAAVGIYAPWGSGKSFLLGHLKSRLQPSDSQALPRLSATCCCCLAELLSILHHSVVFVIARVVANKLWTWLCSCCDALRRSDVSKALGACFERCSNAADPKAVVVCFGSCRDGCGREPALAQPAEQPAAQRDGPSDIEASQKEDASGGTEFVVVEFNAWECAGLEILWAAVTTKIFDAVEKHTAFGKGAVRAARIKTVLEDPSWNWCGLATFYFAVALFGIVVVVVLNATGALDGINHTLRDLQWAVATLLLPGGLSLLNILVQMRSRGSLRTAQSALQKAASKRESVGEAYRGFMSEVKEELETLFLMINVYNTKVKRKRQDEEDETGEKKGSKKREIPKTLALAVIVDDLDRCSREKIMEMLKATHLLLEQPKAPMAVFLAVDPQLIVSAIAESLEGVQNTTKALQYLDKIIHLPFCIPPLSVPKKLSLLDSLLHGSDNTCPKTLKRLKKFLKPDAPSKDDLKAAAESIDEWCSKLSMLLDKTALEFVCTLHWWSQADSVTARSKKPDDALEGLRAGLRKDSKAAWKTRRVACFDLLETLCETINTLMSIQGEELSQAGSTIAPFSDRSIPASDRHGRPVSLLHLSSRTDGEGVGDKSTATSDSVAGRKGDGSRRAGHNPDIQRGGSSGDVAEERSTSQLPAAPLHLFNRATSKGENDTFRALFKVVHATPRKIKRVVNVYFLQRSVAENTEWWKKDSKTREKELVTWTILAEFWPFRLSCIAFAMTNDAPEGKPRQLNYAGNSTIASVYGDSGGGASTSICRWIDDYRGKGTPKDLFLSDDTEGRFRVAMQAGAQVTKDTVANFLMEHSFNLNPAMMSTIEVEMVYDLPETAEE